MCVCRVISQNDPGGHAEMVALREAALCLGNYRLEGTYLYVCSYLYVYTYTRVHTRGAGGSARRCTTFGSL